MMYTAAWLWYALRRALYSIACFLRFISRRGMRIMIVLAIIAAVFLLRDTLHLQLARQMQSFDAGYQPESFVLDIALIICGVVAILAYGIASTLLIFFLGIFRLGMRPTRPLRKLQATKTKITNAVVKIIVPPLPKRTKV